MTGQTSGEEMVAGRRWFAFISQSIRDRAAETQAYRAQSRAIVAGRLKQNSTAADQKR